VGSPVALPVVGENERLVGVVPRITLLAALGNVPATTQPVSIVPATALQLAQELTELVPNALAVAEGGER
jgi:glycine betaine/proline transport system ATP-binding protein